MNAKQIMTAVTGALASITPAFAWDGFIPAIGLPQILLWLLTFAITYGVLKRITNRRAGALIAIALGFLVLMAVPATVITFIASMSTGLVALAVGAVALVAVLGVTGVLGAVVGEKGHPTAIAVILIVIVALMFVGFGGLGFIGMAGIPAITPGMWVLIIVAVAVLWLLSEKPPQPQEK